MTTAPDDTADQSWADQSWYVVNTHPHREISVIEHLRRQGYDPYCPVIIKRIRHARRAYDAKRPLFPSYVFVRMPDDVVRWRPILSTVGVRSLICNGETPSRLNPSFIAALKANEIDGIIRAKTETLKIGQKVTVMGGAFDGLVGEIVELRDNERVAVLLDLLNNKIKTHMNAHDLRV